MRARCDRVFRWVLIYEGGVLAARRVHPGCPLPAVSDVVWRVPRRARVVVAGSLCGYLLWHFMDHN